MNAFNCKNLTEFLLNVVRERPGMYLGSNHISKLPNFIHGYHFSDCISNNGRDFYFGENGFISWYMNTFQQPQLSFWHDYFLIEANGDEVRALAVYFERLEQYYEWYNKNFSDNTST